MSEDLFAGVSVKQILASDFTSPGFRAAMAAVGVSADVATERLRAAAQAFDLAEFDMLIAAHRPKLWARMSRPRAGLARWRAWRPW